MPYLKKTEREFFDTIVESLRTRPPLNSGELNYLLTRTCQSFLLATVKPGTTPRYQDYNLLIGALECAKLELYRRMVATYEDGKIRENGDVY